MIDLETFTRRCQELHQKPTRYRLAIVMGIAPQTVYNGCKGHYRRSDGMMINYSDTPAATRIFTNDELQELQEFYQVAGA